MTTDHWYQISAHNTDAEYGYGTLGAAERYCAYLNRGREVNLYTPVLLSATEVADLQLDDNTGRGFDLDEALVDEILVDEALKGADDTEEAHRGAYAVTITENSNQPSRYFGAYQASIAPTDAPATGWELGRNRVVENGIYHHAGVFGSLEEACAAVHEVLKLPFCVVKTAWEPALAVLGVNFRAGLGMSRVATVTDRGVRLHTSEDAHA